MQGNLVTYEHCCFRIFDYSIQYLMGSRATIYMVCQWTLFMALEKKQYI